MYSVILEDSKGFQKVIGTTELPPFIYVPIPMKKNGLYEGKIEAIQSKIVRFKNMRTINDSGQYIYKEYE